MAKSTPCGVLYSVLGDCAGMKNYDEFDHRIISREPIVPGDRSPYERVTSVRSFRTREIIQKDPRVLNPKTFRDPYSAANNVASYLKRLGVTMGDIAEKFSGPYAESMELALKDWGFNHHLFRNKMNDIVRCGEGQTVVATAVLMLFLATAFYGDPVAAVSAFDRDARKNGLFVKVNTIVSVEDEVPETMEGMYRPMGLQRKFRDGSLGRTYRLTDDIQGTVIGRTEAKGFVINDVDDRVSRCHLRVWREDDFWFAQGQGSTNGSWVIRPDGTEEVIEEPKKTRPRSAVAPIVEIHRGDVIKLSTSTMFNVVTMKE